VVDDTVGIDETAVPRGEREAGDEFGAKPASSPLSLIPLKY